MFYKNTSNAKKTFHGVTFKPGETKSVSGYINDPSFVRAKEMPKEPPKRVDCAKPSSQKSESKNDTIKEETVNGSDSDK